MKLLINHFDKLNKYKKNTIAMKINSIGNKFYTNRK